jgi:hypothetical protein
MKKIGKPPSKGNGGKLAAVAALSTGALLITCSGVWFALYSITNNVSIQVLHNDIPGIVLALLVLYFGVRALLSVRKLSNKILDASASFSWSNFKKAKPLKSR